MPRTRSLPNASDENFKREKNGIETACRALIDDVFKPRFVVRPDPEFNYAVDIRGGWHGRSFRFVQRYRSGTKRAEQFEFDAPFARIEHVGRNRFNVWWFRHTQKWWLLHRGVSLAEAIELMETNGVLHPH